MQLVMTVLCGVMGASTAQASLAPLWENVTPPLCSVLDLPRSGTLAVPDWTPDVEQRGVLWDADRTCVGAYTWNHLAKLVEVLTVTEFPLPTCPAPVIVQKPATVEDFGLSNLYKHTSFSPKKRDALVRFSNQTQPKPRTGKRDKD